MPPLESAEKSLPYVEKNSKELNIRNRSDVSSSASVHKSQQTDGQAVRAEKHGRTMRLGDGISMDTEIKSGERTTLTATQKTGVISEATRDVKQPDRRSGDSLAVYERKLRGQIAENALAHDGGVALNGIKGNFPVYDHLFYRESASVKTHLPSERYPRAYLANYAHDLRVATGEIRAKGGKYAGRDGPSFAAAKLRDMDIPGFDAREANRSDLSHYLRDTATIRIPSDHVKPVQEYVRERASDTPSPYGLPRNHTEQEMNHLLDRIHPVPMTSDEIAKAAREQVATLPKGHRSRK